MSSFGDFLVNISDEAKVILEVSELAILGYLFKTKVSREKLKDSLAVSLTAMSDMKQSIEKIDDDINVLRGDIKKIYTLLIQKP